MSKYITKFNLEALTQPVDPPNLKICVGFDEEAMRPALEALRPAIEEFAEAHPNLSGLEVYQHFQPQIIEILRFSTRITTINS